MVNTRTEEGLKYSHPHHMEDKVVLQHPHHYHYSTDTPINASNIVLLIEIRDENYDNSSRRDSQKTHPANSPLRS